MKLEYRGIVTCGHPSRVADYGEQNGAVMIGGEDVVDDIYERKWKESVVAILNGEQIAKGHVVYNIGCGYSEYTPLEDDELKIDGTDIIDKIREFEGHEAHLVITDED